MNRLLSLFSVQPGEGRLVGQLFVHAFLLGAASSFVQSVAFALFLVEFGAQTLPWIYVVNALATPLAALGLLKAGERLSFSGSLLVHLAFLLVLTIASWVGLWRSAAPWIVFALPVLYQFLSVLGGLELWTLANRLLDVRQGKRLFGLIGSGSWLAVVVTGLLIPRLILRVGSPNLLLLAAASLAAAGGLLAHVTRTFQPQLAAAVDADPARRQRSAGGLHKSRYVLSIFGLMLLSWMAYFFADNVFFHRVEEQFAGEVQLAGFLGTYLALVGLVALLSNALVVGPVMNRYGVRAGLLVLPVTHAALASAMIASASLGSPRAALFSLAVLAKLLDVGLGFSLDKSATAILYQPLPARQRRQAQTMAEGVVQPLANGVAGVALLAVGTLFVRGVTPLIYGLLLIALAWCALATFTGRGYLVMLMRALARRQLQPVELRAEDDATRTILRRALSSPRPGVVVYALNLIEESEPSALPAALQRLLSHSAPQVRQHALQCMERLVLRSGLPSIRAQLREETVPAVRGAAVRALAALGEGDVLGEVSTFLDDPDLDVRRGALVGMLRSGEAQGLRTAGRHLLCAAASTAPEERVLAARALAEAGIGGHTPVLRALLADARVEVQRAALWAAGRVDEPQLWPCMVDALALPGLRKAASAALVASGPRVLSALEVAFDGDGQTPEVAVQVVSLHGRIGGQAAVAWLGSKREHEDTAIRTEVLRALHRCRYRATAAEAASVQEQTVREADLSARLDAILDDLGQGREVQLLRAALGRAAEEGLERVFLLLSLLYDREAMGRAYASLRLATADRTAYALEVVDVLLPQELKRVILPLLAEARTRCAVEELRSAHGRTTERCGQRLREIVAAPPGRFSAWTRSCALYAIGQARVYALAEVVAGALSGPSPIVSETATWAMGRLEEAEPGAPRDSTSDGLAAPMGQIAGWATAGGSQEEVMLTTIEKVLALKSAPIFAETPDESLGAVAALLEEVRLHAGEKVFEKGDLGDCMYVIVHGAVRVHDGARLLGYRSDGDVFGEMALLDPEPRMATVTAAEDTLLLRLEQDALYELMDERSDVARGMIRVLCRRLREQGARPQQDAKLDTPSGLC